MLFARRFAAFSVTAANRGFAMNSHFQDNLGRGTSSYGDTTRLLGLCLGGISFSAFALNQTDHGFAMGMFSHPIVCASADDAIKAAAEAAAKAEEERVQAAEAERLQLEQEAEIQAEIDALLHEAFHGN